MLVTHTQPKVLIIDDDAKFANLVHTLIQTKFITEVSTDSEQALQLVLTRGDFDVVVCDLMLPSLTGMDIYEQLERDGRDLHTRMIFMTGGAYTTRAIEFLKGVKNSRIDKPFSAKELIKLINAVASAN